jgi:hypothetical protein
MSEQTEAEKWLLDRLGQLPRGRAMFTYAPLPISSLMSEYKVRDEFIDRFGFAILTAAAAHSLKKYSPILEVGAGSGYWAYELAKAGVDVIATDPQNFSKWRLWGERLYCEVQNMSGERAVQKFPDRTLLLVWPSYEDPWANNTLQAFKGEKVIYVGEGHGGCTANDAFHDCLAKNFERVEEIRIPQFYGIHDTLEVWQRT